jgi:hypothetical protein
MTSTVIGHDPAAIIPTPKPKPEPIDNTQLVKDFRSMGGRILHCHPAFKRRGITFAFVQKGSRIEVATAVQHRSDDFTKKIGTKVAIEHFNKGKTIFLPTSDNDSIAILRYLSSCL